MRFFILTDVVWTDVGELSLVWWRCPGTWCHPDPSTITPSPSISLLYLSHSTCARTADTGYQPEKAFSNFYFSVAKATLQSQMSVRPFVRPFVRNQNPYTAKNQSVHLKTTFTTTHNITHTISLITLTASHTPLHSSHSQHHTHTITLITLTTSHTSPHTCTTIIHTTITYTNVTTTLSIRVGEKR